MGEAILLIGHGSRDAEGAQEFLGFAEDVRGAIAGGNSVVPCFLELADPPIQEGIDGCVAAGAHTITALPIFLFGGGHQKNDVPSAINWGRLRHPTVQFRYGAHLGLDQRMLAIVDDRLREVEATTPLEPGRTAVLLVERGSSDPDANADVYKLARLLWEGRGWGWVEVCFIGITRPSLLEGIARCAALGAERVIVLPYFLFTGVLVKRIARLAAELQASYPAMPIAVARHIGRDPRLVDLVVDRLASARQGEVSMSCDLCKYRTRLVGFEHQHGLPQTSDAHHGFRVAGGGHDHHHDHHHDHQRDHHHPVNRPAENIRQAGRRTGRGRSR